MWHFGRGHLGRHHFREVTLWVVTLWEVTPDWEVTLWVVTPDWEVTPDWHFGGDLEGDTREVSQGGGTGGWHRGVTQGGGTGGWQLVPTETLSAVGHPSSSTGPCWGCSSSYSMENVTGFT